MSEGIAKSAPRVTHHLDTCHDPAAGLVLASLIGLRLRDYTWHDDVLLHDLAARGHRHSTSEERCRDVALRNTPSLTSIQGLFVTEAPTQARCPGTSLARTVPPVVGLLRTFAALLDV
jgi:hypothetical protein